MNEPGNSKQSTERASVEAIRLLALGAAAAVPSRFKVIGDDGVTLDHDVGLERNGPRGGTGRVWCTGLWLWWNKCGSQEITGESRLGF